MMYGFMISSLTSGRSEVGWRYRPGRTNKQPAHAHSLSRWGGEQSTVCVLLSSARLDTKTKQNKLMQNIEYRYYISMNMLF